MLDLVLSSMLPSLSSHEQALVFMEVYGVHSTEEQWHGGALTEYYLSRDSFIVNSVWYGVQASIGGDCMKVMLRAMWPSVNNIRKPGPDMSLRPPRD